MKYDWIDEYALAKKGVTKDYKVEWDAIRYMIGGKMFIMMCRDKSLREVISLKCEPSFGQMLREKYEHIIPGYYMNKVHWNSVFVDGNVPDQVVKEMLDMSYNLVLSGLTKKMQKEILEG